MKRKIIIAIILALLIFVVAAFVIRNYVGDLRPVFLPPNKNLTELIEKQNVGDQPEFPLKIANDFKIGVFAKDLGSARDLQFTPGGTLLVSSKDRGRVYALPDQNSDGKADELKIVLSGLDEPHGLDFYNGRLFVASLEQVSVYKWDEDKLTASFEKKLFSIPDNGGHSTRSIEIDKDGNLFVTIGSSCNVCLEKHDWLAAVIVSDVDGKNPKVFAKGLRNSVFIKINPETGDLWGTENGRDLIGDNIPPEEINIITEGKNYGWPSCYGNKIHDEKFNHDHKSGECSNTVAPIYGFQAHSAPLGLTFIESIQFPDSWQGDLLVAYHGSWNRSVPTGYKIVRMNVQGNKITGEENFITGFLQGSSALGRPVDLEFDNLGSLYISDDKIGAIYKVVKK